MRCIRTSVSLWEEKMAPNFKDDPFATGFFAPMRFEADIHDCDVRLFCLDGVRALRAICRLHYFMAHPGVVLSQETLLEHVWDEMVDPFTNVVRVTISNLRRKLSDPSVIETIPGRGYRLVDR